MDKYRLRTIENDEAYLRQVSQEVKKGDPKLEHDIRKIANYCRSDGNMIALASIQIGIPKRIIYIMKTNEYDVSKEKDFEDKKIVMINPCIIEEKGETYYWESCASCLNNMGLVKRPYMIRVKYMDEKFNQKEEVFEGFKATVFSHEYDHLFGILHIDIAEKILNMEQEERRNYREKDGNGYIIISKTSEYKHTLR